MKSIQEYIDERPVWPDGTQISGAPMTGMQWLIWSLAAIGKFFEGPKSAATFRAPFTIHLTQG